MDRNLTNIKERVLYISEFKGIRKENFFKRLGVSYANFKGVQKKSALNSNTLDKILSIYPEINGDWLITGKGPMLKKEEDEDRSLQKDPLGIPLIPLDAMAGFGAGEMQVMDYETENYVVPEFEELQVDFMIRVKGSSMQPKYNSGDLVACRKLDLNNIFFQWNKVYVLDTDQGALVKRIKKAEKSDHLLIVSDNTNYDPFELHRDHINAIALVVGVIRLE